MSHISSILGSLTLALAALAGHLKPQEAHVGTVFNFQPDEGACGSVNNGRARWDGVDVVLQLVSVSTLFPHLFQAALVIHLNPICNSTLSIQVNNKTLNVKVVDSFPEDNDAGSNDVGITKMDFKTLAPLRDGTIPNATWSIV
ncbi:hypothetical protein C8J57DRAFT_1246425 [Mycena rebaudengoi]|nr:hypothetical protein C8J57DRAFT_1246425 [Mycena rebaudengoi]